MTDGLPTKLELEAPSSPGGKRRMVGGNAVDREGAHVGQHGRELHRYLVGSSACARFVPENGRHRWQGPEMLGVDVDQLSGGIVAITGGGQQVEAYRLTQAQRKDALAQANLVAFLRAPREKTDPTLRLGGLFLDQHEEAASRATADAQPSPAPGHGVSHGAACHGQLRMLVVQSHRLLPSPGSQNAQQSLRQACASEDAAVEQHRVGDG